MTKYSVGNKIEISKGEHKGKIGTIVALSGKTQCTVECDDDSDEKNTTFRIGLSSVRHSTSIGTNTGAAKSGKKRKSEEIDSNDDDDDDDVVVSKVFAIVDERRRKKRKSTRRVTEYLCKFKGDGGKKRNPKWIEAARLKKTTALEEWNELKRQEQEDDDEEDGEEEVPEIFESELVVKDKSETLAEWLKNAKRPVFLLGAGISAPVLPTFRGKNGLWTKNAHKNETPQDCVAAQPTFAHYAIAAMERAGHVYFCVTQNYDDLSNRSGYPRNKLSELHGNIFVETCNRCGHEYHRDFEVVKDDAVDHETGRSCEQEGCKGRGMLRDNIIHFDEALPWHELKMANAKFSGADLTIVIGSSLHVEPAASMPFKGKYRHRNPNTQRPKAVIINLQPTHYDDDADLIIRGSADDVLRHVTKVLGVSVAEQQQP